MSLKIETGLFFLDDFRDCHAILGISVEADAKAIRKRYLKVAQRLHPDSFVNSSGDEKELATELFSKLVGPAYNTLSKDRDRKEYLLLISLKGKQGIQQRTSIQSFCDLAKQVWSSNKPEEDYANAIVQLSDRQYEDLSQVLWVTGQLSEVNLVYLMRREAQGQPSSSRQSGSSAAPATASSSNASGGMATSASSSTTEMPNPTIAKPSVVEGYLRRAEEYMAKKAYAQAILELRDALNLAPKDSRCHSLMGVIYLQQNQLTMAKVSIKRALELNPQDTTAIKTRVQLEKLGQVIEPGQRTSSSSHRGSPSKDPKGGSSNSGGLFGGLFGGKKK
ncbi:MAG: DnaJ domain-containing protein [Prochlorotrichaceae cyanobacterium]